MLSLPIFTDIRRWMFDEALPFWGHEGVDRRHGGYVEHFTLDGAPYSATKRIFVLCRQIYVFAHASLLGWPDGVGLAEHGYRFLLKARLPDHGGWARRVDQQGIPVDPAQDLYVLSFVLFGLAWYYRVSEDKQAITLAHQTLDVIERRLPHPSGLGFRHEDVAAGPWQQNPHMHLLEALLALARFTQNERFLQAADGLVDLATSRFYDPASRTLAEVFGDDWRRLPDARGRITEPGHHFEWAWILAHYRTLSRRDVTDPIIGLHDFAERHGVDPVSRITYNGVRDDGLPLDKGSRTWPNTERMKAAVALYETTGRPAYDDLEQSGRLVLTHYLGTGAPGTSDLGTRHLGTRQKGCWIDAFDADRRPCVDKIPTSTLYHVFLAFAEALRYETLPGAMTASPP